MIKANFFAHSDDEQMQIDRFEIKGHSNYGDHGKDIVCAAVSALSITTINSMTELLKLSVEYSEDEGKLNCLIPVVDSCHTNSKVQLLAHALLLGLESIASEFPDNIDIKIITK